MRIIAEIKANFSDFWSISLINKNKRMGIRELKINVGRLFKDKLTFRILRRKETIKIIIKKVLLFTNDDLTKNSIIRIVDCVDYSETRNWKSR